LGSTNKETILHWINEATEPRNPELQEVEADVVKAWKMEKARAVVEEETKKLMQEVAAAPDNYRKLVDMKGYTPGQTIARFSEPEIKSFAEVPMYQQAKLPAIIDNEPADFVTQCLEKLEKQGDTVTIPDKSKTVYYLIYLANRSEPRANNPLDVEAFHNEVIRPARGRQMMVDNMEFRNFVAQRKRASEQTQWIEYLKSVTKMNDELAKNITMRR
ncbi:MAG TPA: hypothetical protein PKA06_16995, partial [Gemmatales bacterium]|nr:hypothetical protein [Gemmatales bacterium]